MITISLPVNDGITSSEPGVPCLETYLLENYSKPLGAVLVCPGGGYEHRAAHEAGAVAMAFNKRGYHAFVLQYRISPCRHPAPLSDAVHAMRLIRSKATEWGVDPNHVAVCGFSAGGHLAGSLGVFHSLIPTDDYYNYSARPDAMILAYAVLASLPPKTHKGSMDNLLGKDAPDSLRDKFSIIGNVNKDTPQTFLWHMSDDRCVPVENALDMAAALSKAGVEFELHTYRKGGHGIGLATDKSKGCSPNASTWIDLCIGWLEEIGFPRNASSL